MLGYKSFIQKHNSQGNHPITYIDAKRELTEEELKAQAFGENLRLEYLNTTLDQEESKNQIIHVTSS